jgi:hypothetical protein
VCGAAGFKQRAVGAASDHPWRRPKALNRLGNLSFISGGRPRAPAQKCRKNAHSMNRAIAQI